MRHLSGKPRLPGHTQDTSSGRGAQKGPVLKRALRLARRANEATEYRNPHYLDTLALALHRAGDTASAVVSQRKALGHAPESVKDSCQKALARYESALKNRRQ